MTVFYCAKCGTALTGELVALPEFPTVDDPDRDRDKKTERARSTVPRGRYAVDPGPTGSSGWRDSVVVHPDDVLPRLEPFRLGSNWAGCCGPTGTHGPNLACVCGARLATWAADCIGPYELHLDPVRVYAWHGDAR